jgi:hypothetical protein
MNRTFTKLIVGFSCLVVTTLSAQLTPEVLYYNFNGSGTSVPNLASAPPPGTATATTMGGVTQGGNGICRGTLIGSGVTSTTDYLNTGWAPNLGTGSWTIAWRCEGISTNATLYYIFGDIGSNSFRCFTNGVAGSTNWIIRGGGLTDSYINGGALTTATHCAFVYDNVANVVRGYLNGALVSTTAQTAPNITGAGPFKVMGYSSNVGAPSGGMLDEFRVYSRALTAGEISQLSNPFASGGFAGADVNFCTGNSVTLNVGNWPTAAVAWSTGSTFDTTMVSAPGMYSVSVSGDCGTGSDTINVIDTRTSAAINDNICGGSYTAPSGAVYTMAGTYVDTIPNAALCDSLITITLTTGSPTTSSFSVSACDMYMTPSGNMVMSSGTVMDTIPNSLGCDSIMTIAVTINTPTTSTFSATACGMYTTPSGATVTSSGTVMDTIANMNGCDSIMTINVTINTATTSSMNASACDTYTAPSGATYTSSGTYMDTIPNMAGCDSVMTIQLTITNTTTATISASACNSYTAPSGATYTSSGTVMDTIPNMAGCDSIITINLTVNTQTQSSMNASICGGTYTAPSGATYTQTGTYLDTIPNMAGCDSIITITLQVTTVDTSVTVISIGTLQAAQSGATYQWLDCNNNLAPVAGATTQTWTPFQNGSYACAITIGNCTDTSGCHQADPIGINESAFGSSITLYPNPNSGNFTINLGSIYSDVTVVITDLAGRVVYTRIENSTNMIPVQLDAAAGSYVITVTSGENRASFIMHKE